MTARDAAAKKQNPGVHRQAIGKRCYRLEWELIGGKESNRTMAEKAKALYCIKVNVISLGRCL